MAGKQGSGLFQVALTEAAVRDLCSSRAFEQGDSWQRSGHVHNPLYVDDTLQAEVVGTWQRIDNVTLRISGSKLQTECTCRLGLFCRHAAAVLLQWVRKPSVFQLPARVTPDLPTWSGDTRQGAQSSGAQSDEETPLEEYSRLLATHTMVDLREIAKRRGVTGTAQRKSDLLAHMLPLITTTTSVDFAIAGLSSDAQLVLVLVDLMKAAGTEAVLATVFPLFRAFGGEDQRDAHRLGAIEELVALGLLFRASHAYDAYSGLLKAPRLVTARLPRLAQLVRTIRTSQPDPASWPTGALDAIQSGPSAPNDPANQLSLAELIQVIALEIRQGTVGRRRPQLRLDDVRPAPPAWRIEAREPVTTTNRWHTVHNWRLAPLPGLLVSSDRQRLAQRTGQSADAIDFATQLMVHLGIIDPGRHANSRAIDAGSPEPLTLREETLRRLFMDSAEQRLALMVETWLTQMDAATELRLIVGPKRTLELYIREGARSGSGPGGTHARRLLARIVGHLAGLVAAELDHPDNLVKLARQQAETTPWYDIESVLDLVAHLNPELLAGAVRGYDYTSWWFANREHPAPDRPAAPDHPAAVPLNLSQTNDWRHVWRLLLVATLEGPLAWLGLVELLHVPIAAPPDDPAQQDTADQLESDTDRASRDSGSVDEAPTEDSQPPHRLVGFRPTAAAGVLLGRPDDPGQAVQLPNTSISARPVALSLDPAEPDAPVQSDVPARSDDPVRQVLLVTVPAGGADEQLLAALATTGELDTAVAEGLRFRLSPDRLQVAFDAGLDGDELIAFLAERAGGAMPDNVRTLLEGWWREYGTVRLYDELAFVELSDDVLLRELRAVTSLRTGSSGGDWYLEQLSPRVVAVDPARVDELLNDLTRAGYTPRLLDEG